MAEALAAGSSTTEVAERFGVLPGRVSRELHGELVAEGA
jgi:hypothetical protein